MILFLEILLLVLLTFVVFIGFYYLSNIIALFFARGVPYVPLTKKQLLIVKNNIKISKTDKVVDLGCGDGRVVRLFEKMGVDNVSGYEINFVVFVLAKIKNYFRKSKSQIYCKNFNKIDLQDYNVIFCYLLEHYLAGMRDKFDQELKPGTIIISYAFEIKNWRKPIKIINPDKNKPGRNRIFIYEITEQRNNGITE